MTGTVDENRFRAAHAGYLKKIDDLLFEHGDNECFIEEMTDANIEHLALTKIRSDLDSGDPDVIAHVIQVYGDLVPTWERVVAEYDDTCELTFNAFRGRPISNRAENDRLRAAEKKTHEDLPVYNLIDGTQLDPSGNYSETLDPSDNYSEVMELLQVKTEVRTVKAADGSTKKEQFNKPIPTGFNFLTILANDHRFEDLRFNTMRDAAERVRNGKRTMWTDADDADAQLYIETVYGIMSTPRYMIALTRHLQDVRYNPVQEAILETQWDGRRRVEEFLIRWAGADDNPVNRECSRLLFAGGIHRAFEPGCKFDCCIVLIGAQGAGKSTLCRWLAIDDDFYTSLKTMHDQKGSEAIQGKWIVEAEELLAFIANKKSGSFAEEEAKAFLSRQAEHYRQPYERRSKDTLRTNIFIGTTNKDEFLEDPTGNRRWYPVTCHCNGIDLQQHEQECREYIRQAWAEIYTAYRLGEDLARPFTSRNLENEIKVRQRSAEVEDEWIGIIEDFLDREQLDKTCVIQLWYEAINYDRISRQPTNVDKRRIGAILTSKLGWKRAGVARFGNFGSQKSFLRPTGLTGGLTDG